MTSDLRKPVVKVINSQNEILEAWKLSRPHLSGEDLDLHLLNDLDLPVQGFGQAMIYFEGSIAMRELIFSLRPSVCWAISYRTIDLQEKDLAISEEVPDRLKAENLQMNRNFLETKKTVPQDLCKSMVSYGTLVGFSVSLDYRTLAFFIHSIKNSEGRIAQSIYDLYCKPILEQIPDLENIPTRGDIIPGITITEEELRIRSGAKLGRITAIGGKVQGVLLAQFIRKQYDKVVTNLPTLFLSGNIFKKDQRQEFNALAYLPAKSVDHLYGVRTCWFAKFDKADSSSWDSVLDVKGQTLDEFEKGLPCQGCASKCVFEKEQLPRLIGGNDMDYKSKGETNPPCPIMVGMSGVVDLRKLKYNPNSEIFNKWEDFIARKDLKINKLGEEYWRNVSLHGFAEELDNENGLEYLNILEKSINR